MWIHFLSRFVFSGVGFMRTRISTVVLLSSTAFAIVTFADSVSATEAIENTGVRCALLCADASPVSTLLESKLLARDSEVWLERQEIDRVLAERELQAAFGAKDVVNRAALGKVLKADVLVMLRSGTKNNQPFAEVVVAQTAGGLRLLARTVPLTDEPANDAVALKSLIDDALAKHCEAIREVYAIPPFVSQDLTRNHDHLKAAYARIIEQTLLTQPGILVVELEEADALIRECELATAGDRPSRRLPLYVLGEYRHEGVGKKEEITLAVELKRGSNRVKLVENTMPPGSAADYLRQALAELLPELDEPGALPDARVEARELAARGQLFLTLGNWSEALSLFEASLLLDPDNAASHREAVRAGVELAAKARKRADEIRLRRRAFEHCQAILALQDTETLAAAVNYYSMVHQSLDTVRGDQGTSDETLAQLEDLIRQEAEFCEQLTELRSEQSEWKAVPFLAGVIRTALPRERYASRAEHLIEHQDKLTPTEKWLSVSSGADSVERREFLCCLRDSPEIDEEFRSCAETALREMDDRVDWEVRDQSREPTGTGETSGGTATSSGELTGRPIRLMRPRNNGTFQLSHLECLAIEGGVDLIWGRDDKADRIPLSIVTTPDQEPKLLCSKISSPTNLMYDGRLVWLEDSGKLWIVDPVEGDCWHVSGEDGIPTEGPGVRTVVPVENGKAIVAGNAGNRGWIAEVTLSREGKHSVNVFHEAKEELASEAQYNNEVKVQSEAHENAWRNPYIACSFSAGRLFPFPDTNGVQQQRALILRGVPKGGSFAFMYHPLVVNPDDLSLTVLESEYPGGAVHDGSCYFAERQGFDAYRLMRAGPPHFTPELAIPGISEGMPEIATGRYILWQDTLTIIGEDWLQMDLQTGRVIACCRGPWTESHHPRIPKDGDINLRSGFGYSNHFGYFVNCRERGGGAAAIQVVQDGSGMTFREVIHTLHEPAAHKRRASTSRAAKKQGPRKENLWQTNGCRYYTDLAYSPDGQYIITTCHNNPCVQAWDASTGWLVADLMEHSDAMRSVVFDRSGEYFATSGAEGSFFLWSTQELNLLHSIEGTESDSGGDKLAFSWDGSLLASSSLRARAISIWNTRDGKANTKITSDRSLPGHAEFTPDGCRLIAFDGPQTELWTVGTGRPAGVIETVHRPLGFLPSGELLAVASNLDRSVIAWDLQANTHRVLWQRSPRNILAVSHDGRYLLERRGKFPRHMEPSLPQLIVWDIEEHTQVASTESAINAHRWRFSPDGTTIVAVGTALWRWCLDRVPARTQMRTWKDDTGEFSVEASFEELTSAGVRLKRREGAVVTVPLQRLSSESREFLGTIPTAELSPHAPPNRDDLQQPGAGWLEGFGRPLDPDGDCSFKLDRWMLTVDVPGSHHDLSSEIGSMNAPRVVCDVDCDFAMVAQVDAEFSPRNSAIKGRQPYQAAGVFAMQDDKTYLRV